MTCCQLIFTLVTLVAIYAEKNKVTGGQINTDLLQERRPPQRISISYFNRIDIFNQIICLETQTQEKIRQYNVQNAQVPPYLLPIAKQKIFD